MFDITLQNLKQRRNVLQSYGKLSKAQQIELGLIDGQIFMQEVVVNLEKGKKAGFGEIREWGGGKYQKTTQGWVPVSKHKPDHGGTINDTSENDEGLNKLKQFLSLFPDDAQSWADATDEVRDLARSAKELFNEMHLENSGKKLQPLDFRKFDKPSEWNKKGKQYILNTFSKMSNETKKQFLKQHSELLDQYESIKETKNSRIKKSNDNVEIDKQDFVDEHKNLVNVLKHGSKKERKEEADEQESELKEEIEKSFVDKKIDIIKGGEGSRGGQIIGHTRSGKPVYANRESHSYADFSKQDHEDAATHHKEMMNKTKGKEAFRHKKLSSNHDYDSKTSNRSEN